MATVTKEQVLKVLERVNDPELRLNIVDLGLVYNVDITEDNDAITASEIPINQGQVVLYDASTCKVVKWTVTPGDEVGEATGKLPKKGDFIIGVKYNPSSLKGKDVPNPTTVEYTFGAELDSVAFDEATVVFVPKTT